MTTGLRSPAVIEGARHLCGLLILWLSVLPPMFEFGWTLYLHLVPSLSIAFIITAFLLLLRPRIGTIRELRGISGALTVFGTTAIWSSLVLGRGDTALLTSIIDGFRSGIAWFAGLVSGPLGESAAALAMRPFALLLIGLVLASFVFRSYAGFLVAAGLFFGWGSLPPTTGLVAGALLWFAGFSLIAREALYLTSEEERHVRASPWLRRLLLECRDGSLDSGRLHLLLGTGNAARADLRFALDTGLVSYDPAHGRLCPSERLCTTTAPGFIHSLARFADGIARVSLVIAAVFYVVFPVDLLPEAVLGPIGYLDDLAVLLSSLWPSLAPLLRRGGPGSPPDVGRSFPRVPAAEAIRAIFPPSSHG